MKKPINLRCKFLIYTKMFKSCTYFISLFVLVIINVSCQSNNQGIPEYIKDVVAYKEGPDGIIVYFSLADQSGKEVSSNGTISLYIRGDCRFYGSTNNKLLLGSLELKKTVDVKYSDFYTTDAGQGAFKRKILLYSFGRIKKDDMSFLPNNYTDDMEGKSLHSKATLKWMEAEREQIVHSLGSSVCNDTELYVGIDFTPIQSNSVLENYTNVTL